MCARSEKQWLPVNDVCLICICVSVFFSFLFLCSAFCIHFSLSLSFSFSYATTTRYLYLYTISFSSPPLINNQLHQSIRHFLSLSKHARTQHIVHESQPTGHLHNVWCIRSSCSGLYSNGAANQLADSSCVPDVNFTSYSRDSCIGWWSRAIDTDLIVI